MDLVKLTKFYHNKEIHSRVWCFAKILERVSSKTVFPAHFFCCTCSKTSRTEDPFSISVDASPGWIAAPRGEANGWPTGPVRLCSGIRNAGAAQGTPPLPPRNRYGPHGILLVCCQNLWPTVRMKLGHEGWLKQPVTKVMVKIASKEDLSWWVIRDHVKDTNVASSRSVGASPGHKTLPPGWEANSWPTRPVRLCQEMKTMTGKQGEDRQNRKGKKGQAE